MFFVFQEKDENQGGKFYDNRGPLDGESGCVAIYVCTLDGESACVAINVCPYFRQHYVSVLPRYVCLCSSESPTFTALFPCDSMIPCHPREHLQCRPRLPPREMSSGEWRGMVANRSHGGQNNVYSRSSGSLPAVLKCCAGSVCSSPYPTQETCPGSCRF